MSDIYRDAPSEAIDGMFRAMASGMCRSVLDTLAGGFLHGDGGQLIPTITKEIICNSKPIP